MNTFILEYNLPYLVSALILTLGLALVIRKVDKIGVNLSLLCLIVATWVFLGLKLANQKFYLESPSQNQPAYILKFHSGKTLLFLLLATLNFLKATLPLLNQKSPYSSLTLNCAFWFLGLCL